MGCGASIPAHTTLGKENPVRVTARAGEDEELQALPNESPTGGDRRGSFSGIDRRGSFQRIPSNHGGEFVNLNQEERFKGIEVGMAVLCRDTFTSKYTKEKMSKWRPAFIKVYDGSDKTSKVRVHFDGWNDKFDKWLDIDAWQSAEGLEVVPLGTISLRQIELGTKLTDEQNQAAYSFFCTGNFIEADSTAIERDAQDAGSGGVSGRSSAVTADFDGGNNGNGSTNQDNSSSNYNNNGESASSKYVFCSMFFLPSFLFLFM
jgi:hypothetical protein